MSDYFIFGGIDTRSFEGISVYFKEVDNTPKRVYQTVDIPARNGAFYIDEGRYEDIDHSYDIIALTKEIGSNFINALASKIGYFRLEDSFNVNEFYSAVFTSGVDVNIPSSRGKSTFRITFTRKPQRFLTSGETATAVANNGTVTNPTLFESSPLLAIKGYGTIGFNGYEIELENEVLGHIVLKNNGSLINVGTSYPLTFAGSLLNNGDTITIGPFYFPWELNTTGGAVFDRQDATLVSNTGITGSSATVDGNRNAKINIPSLTFTKGTPTSYSNTTVVSVALMNPSSSCTAQLVLTISYDGANTITISATDTYSVAYVIRSYVLMRYNEIVGESTKSILGNPTYIDCDLGDAYKIENNEYVSLNHKVDLGSDLPKLASGSNTVTYDNTVTELKITPRWWKV